MSVSKCLVATLALVTEVHGAPSLRGTRDAEQGQPVDVPVASAADPKANAGAESAIEEIDPTDSLWAHIGHTSATWGRGSMGGRWGHVGHTGATWGRPFMMFDSSTAALNDTDSENTSDNSSVDEDLWMHVGHTGASWGRGPFGGRWGHIGHTGATWGHPFMMFDNSTAENAPAGEEVSEEQLWGHIGHTGVSWGRGPFGRRWGHIGHTGATWGRPFMMFENSTDAENSSANDSGEADSSTQQADLPDSADGEMFWRACHTGASWGRGRPWMMVENSSSVGRTTVEGSSVSEGKISAEDFDNGILVIPAEETGEFWVHVGRTCARVGWTGVHVGHTGATIR